MNTELRKKAKKDFFKSMNNSVCEKNMENIRKHRDIIKLVTTETRRNYLV